jgi:TRAP-type C4-dicarboxylate transport system substrate-binding protein
VGQLIASEKGGGGAWGLKWILALERHGTARSGYYKLRRALLKPDRDRHVLGTCSLKEFVKEDQEMKRLTKVFCIIVGFVLIAGVTVGECAEFKPLKLTAVMWGNNVHDAPAAGLWLLKERLEKETGGKVTLDINPAGVFGKAGENYDLLLNGVVDVCCFAPAFTPGRFPMASVGDLPLWVPDIHVTTKLFRELAKKGYFDSDFKDVVLIGLHGNWPYFFGWRDKPVLTLADFKGKKVRAPGGLYPKMLAALGASAVSLPAGEVYTAVEKGIADGAFVNFSMMWDYQLPEIMKYITLPRCSTFLMGMAFNKRSWANLPKGVKAIIEKLSFEKMVDAAVDAQLESEAKGEKLFDSKGGKRAELSAADVKKAKELYVPIFANWTKNLEAKGLPAKKLLDDTYSILEGLGVKEPFIAPK